MSDGEVLKISWRDWSGLIVLAVTWSVGGVIAFYSMSNHQRTETEKLIKELDERWQDRITMIVKDVKSDIKLLDNDLETLENGIPPTWFHKMVEQNAEELKTLREIVIELRSR